MPINAVDLISDIEHPVNISSESDCGAANDGSSSSSAIGNSSNTEITELLRNIQSLNVAVFANKKVVRSALIF